MKQNNTGLGVMNIENCVCVYDIMYVDGLVDYGII